MYLKVLDSRFLIHISLIFKFKLYIFKTKGEEYYKYKLIFLELITNVIKLSFTGLIVYRYILRFQHHLETLTCTWAQDTPVIDILYFLC